MPNTRRLTPAERVARELCPVHGACVGQIDVFEDEDGIWYVSECTRSNCNERIMHKSGSSEYFSVRLANMNRQLVYLKNEL